MSIDTQIPSLDVLRRPSGAFAMLAVDQREALRTMMSEATGGRQMSDEDVTGFKLAAARLLTPYASAVLMDRQFVLHRGVAEGVIADGCSLIAAGDYFIPVHGEMVGDVKIDNGISPAQAKELGADAMKLLVIYRPDLDPAPRKEMVAEFIQGCHAAGLLSIIEPLSKKPLDQSAAWNWNEGVLAVAEELGGSGQDLYKAEVPLHGKGSEQALRAACAAMTNVIRSPWVVLSSGVAEADFPRAIECAILEGAAGFLAGRAVWASTLTAPDLEHELATAAVARLQHFDEIADAAMAERANR